MTERSIRRIVNLLIKNGLVSETEYENFVYVLLGDAESLIVIVSILLLGIIIGQAMPTIGFLICFFALRNRTGGYHMDSFCKCYWGTMVLYLLISGIVCVASEYTGVFLGSAAIAMAVILLFGSINHPNIDMENDELQESKTMSRIIVSMEFCVILFLVWMGNAEVIVAYLSLAIVLCAILLIMAKVSGQEVKRNEGN